MVQQENQQNYVLAVDQGTTGSAALILGRDGRVAAWAEREITQHHPEPGWVSHDPEEIFQSVLAVSREAMASAGIEPQQLAAIGITNQRETTVVWDRVTGQPVAPAIVWQCRRTAGLCEELKQRGMEPMVRERTGLVIDPYFSATKIRWLLDHTPDGQRRAEAGELCAGTIDSWLLYRLTGGRVHATDVSNASRTMLFNIHTHSWDDDLISPLGIPLSMLPEVRPSSSIFGETDPGLFGAAVPIACLIGDQSAALFGQACFQPGMVKNTYGTGSFLLMQTGEQPVPPPPGLLTTIAWQRHGQKTQYALEGSVFITGAAIQWLRDGLGIIEKASDTEEIARSVADTGGVYFVPAFAGLGAPHWDMYARGTIVGLTGGTTRAHIVRATLEAIAYQVRDVLEVMRPSTKLEIPLLRADGGGAANAFLMQFQADILGIPVDVPEIAETTALGAAYLAGLAVGFWGSQQELTGQWSLNAHYEPRMSREEANGLYDGWQRAMERARDWERPG
ncbi:MAG: glycerol kinase GlpK [Chloroflexi bacterium]|nr:glycerol kinase GlpK [Chloroflexota bacterium]